MAQTVYTFGQTFPDGLGNVSRWIGRGGGGMKTDGTSGFRRYNDEKPNFAQMLDSFTWLLNILRLRLFTFVHVCLYQVNKYCIRSAIPLDSKEARNEFLLSNFPHRFVMHFAKSKLVASKKEGEEGKIASWVVYYDVHLSISTVG